MAISQIFIRRNLLCSFQHFKRGFSNDLINHHPSRVNAHRKQGKDLMYKASFANQFAEKQNEMTSSGWKPNEKIDAQTKLVMSDINYHSKKHHFDDALKIW